MFLPASRNKDKCRLCGQYGHFARSFPNPWSGCSGALSVSDFPVLSTGPTWVVPRLVLLLLKGFRTMGQLMGTLMMKALLSGLALWRMELSLALL